jgi:pilus assembly protein CpaF
MEGQTVTLQDLFRFQQTGVGEDGKVLGFTGATGIRPGFAEKFEQAGVVLPPDLFVPRR